MRSLSKGVQLNAPSELLTFVVLTSMLLAACDGNEDEPSGPTEPPPPSPTSEVAELSGDVFLTTNRDHIAFCAAGTGGYTITEDDADRIAVAIEQVVERVGDAWPQSRTQFSISTIECPAATVPLGADKIGEKEAIDYAVWTDRPSVYRVVIYFTQENLYSMTFGEVPHVAAPAELLCEGDDCAEVTTALYVPVNVVGDALEDALFEAVGIVPE